MKNKKLKKTFITAGCVIVGIALVFGILFLIKGLNRKPVNVYDIANVSMTDYWGDQSETSGSVSMDNMQKVFPSDSQTVTEVFVKEGQKVKKGDRLMSYDTTLTQLEVSKAEIALKKKKIELKTAQETVNRLGSQKSSEELEAELTRLEKELQQAVADTPGGTAEMPKLPLGKWNASSPRYIEASGNMNIGSLFSEAGTDDIYVVLVTVHDDTYVNYQGLHFTKITGEPVTGADGSIKVPAESSCYVEPFEAERLSPSTPVETEKIKRLKEQIAGVQEELGRSMSKEDIAKARAEQEKQIKSLNIEIKIADVNLREKKAELSDGVVYSKIDGVIKTIRSPEEAKQDNAALIEVSAGGGYYIIGTLNELELQKVKVGQTVTVSSWQTGAACDGEIVEISNYPSSENMGDPNRNLSYYPFKVFVSGDENLKESDYVSISYTPETEASGAWYLDKMFIRQKDGRSYVFIKGDNGKLEKRFISTGKDLWGSYTEVKEGLTPEGFIAFPYGKEVTEGAKTTEADLSSLYNY